MEWLVLLVPALPVLLLGRKHVSSPSLSASRSGKGASACVEVRLTTGAVGAAWMRALAGADHG